MMPSPSSPSWHPPDRGVAIVVLNWNGWRDTIACLESLAKLDHPNQRVIVVDNGSDDGSADRIRKSTPGVTVLETGTNLGFAGGCNVGIRHALAHGASFVWLLNNDTIAVRDSLGAMVDEMQRRDDVGIVGSVVRPFGNPDSIELWGGGALNRFLGTTRKRTVPGARRLDYVAGTSMLIRREVLEDVGLLDEDFFFYMEDVEFCRRAAAASWQLAVASGAAVLHKGGATVNEGRPARSERGDRLYVRSSGIFLGKHAGRWAVAAAPLRLVGILARRASRGELRRIPTLGWEFLQGFAFGIRRRAWFRFGLSRRPA